LDLQVVSDVQMPALLQMGHSVRELAAAAARRAGLDASASELLRLAVTEAFTNAVRHGCGTVQASTDRRVGIRFLLGEDRLVVEVRDPGPGFCPGAVSMTLPGEVKSGGRGLYFMQMAMDYVVCEFKEGTLVRMTKLLTDSDKSRAGS
jgi:serine/threonine-protein kinase RsbW